MFRSLIVVLSLLAFPAIAEVSPCYEPTRPSCLTSFATFEDEFSFDRCRRQLEEYRRQVDTLAYCLTDWTREVYDEAEYVHGKVMGEYDRAVDYWNCMVDQRLYCSPP